MVRNSRTFNNYVEEFFLTLSQASPSFYVSAVQVFENTVGKGEIADRAIFSSTGHRPASLCHGPLSVMRPSVY